MIVRGNKVWRSGTRVVLILLIALLAVAVRGAIADRPVVKLVADEWCPFNCRPDSKTPGMLVEIAREALATQGYQVEYKEMPWPRAIYDVSKGRYHGIIGTGRDETPEFHFPDQPLAYAGHSIFTRPEHTWRYTGLPSLDEVRLGVIQDYSYGGLWKDYVQANRKDSEKLVILSGKKPLVRLIKLLQLGRTDAIAAEERVLAHHFRSQGRPNPLRNAGMAYREPLYVAFSPSHPDGEKMAKALSAGLSELEITGRLQDIIDAYDDSRITE